jgi:hypothetical protein
MQSGLGKYRKHFFNTVYFVNSGVHDFSIPQKILWANIRKVACLDIYIAGQMTHKFKKEGKRKRQKRGCCESMRQHRR